MAKHNITRAEDIYQGAVYWAPYSDGQKRAGLPIDGPIRVNIGAPDLGDLDLLIDSATSTELPDSTTITYTTADDGSTPIDNGSRPSTATITTSTGQSASVWELDVPRALQAKQTAGSTNTIASTVTITGYDEYKVKVVEEITLPVTATSVTVGGVKAMKYIESIAITAAADITGETIEVGTSDVIGLPFRIDQNDQIIVFEDGAIATAGTLVTAVTTDPATATTGDVRGTINPDMTLDGSKRLTVMIWPTGRDTKANAFGVDQYGG